MISSFQFNAKVLEYQSWADQVKTLNQENKCVFNIYTCHTKIVFTECFGIIHNVYAVLNSAILKIMLLRENVKLWDTICNGNENLTQKL